MELKAVKLENPDSNEIIIGQGNFSVKTVDDLYKAIYESVPGIEFGVAMNDAQARLVRKTGNNELLEEKAAKACKEIGAGHAYVVYLSKAFPVHVLNAVKDLNTIANVLAATSNPVEVIVAETDQGRAMLGVVDGFSAERLEEKKEKEERRGLLERLGFKAK